MKEIIPGVVEASKEKHIPAVTVEGGKVVVNIGSVDHPMVPEHYIEWIAILTKEGTQLKYLQPGQKPNVCFVLTEGDALLETYAYCNLHGLWKA
jgi:superoxide reductase